jgi:hypothetical protein
VDRLASRVRNIISSAVYYVVLIYISLCQCVTLTTAGPGPSTVTLADERAVRIDARAVVFTRKHIAFIHICVEGRNHVIMKHAQTFKWVYRGEIYYFQRIVEEENVCHIVL